VCYVETWLRVAGRDLMVVLAARVDYRMFSV